MNKYYIDGMQLMHQIYQNFSHSDKKWFRKEPPALMHHNLGRHLRNHCNMWTTPWTPVIIDDVDHSPEHPDAISQQVIKDYQQLAKEHPDGVPESCLP